MKIKKEYIYSKGRQIWRLLTTSGGRLVIEERNVEAREVFFSCIDVKSGKELFSNYQLNEKFWIGIEAIINDVIYFHKYLKPDMPQHQGIIAFDINSRQILWEAPDYSYLFVKDDKLYCYRQKFEGRDFFILDPFTGQILEDGTNPAEINVKREHVQDDEEYKSYLFPEIFYPGGNTDQPVDKLLYEFKSNNIIIGPLEYLCYQGLILMNSFEPNGGGTLINTFRVIDIESGKVIFQEVLNKNAHAAVPDSFFMKNNNVFLLQEKTKLLVCSVMK